MQRLGYNQTNDFIVSLSDMTTLTSATPYYLFQFVSLSTNAEYFFTAPDISTNTMRYNKFSVTITGGTQNLTAGTVNVGELGEYNFYCYQQYSQTNIALSGVTGGPINQGLIMITGSSQSYTNQTSYSGMSTTYGYYQP